MSILKYEAPKKRRGFISAVNQNNSIIFIIFCFLLGFLTGVLLFKFKNTAGGFYSDNFSKIYSGLKGDFWQVLCACAYDLFPFAAGIFLSGTCMMGSLLVPAIIIIRGMWLSFTMAYTYCNFGLMGIVFNLLILVPACIISTVALSLSARESLGFSLSLARLAVPGTVTPKIDKDFKLFCLRQLFMLIFFTVSCFIQAIMSVSFISFFTF